MKNPITELLLRLVQKEEESQDLVVQIETLERVIIEMLYNMTWNDRQMFIHQIEGALTGGSHIPAFLTNVHNTGEHMSKTLRSTRGGITTNYHRSVTLNTYNRFVLILPYLCVENME